MAFTIKHLEAYTFRVLNRRGVT